MNFWTKNEDFEQCAHVPFNISFGTRIVLQTTGRSGHVYITTCELLHFDLPHPRHSTRRPNPEVGSLAGRTGVVQNHLKANNDTVPDDDHDCVANLLWYPVLVPQITGDPDPPAVETLKVSSIQSPMALPTPAATAAFCAAVVPKTGLAI